MCWSTTQVSRPQAYVHELDEAAWDRTLAVNLKGPFLTCREAVRRWRGTTRWADRQRQLVGRVYGLERGMPTTRPRKPGSGNFTVSLAREMGPHGDLRQCGSARDDGHRTWRATRWRERGPLSARASLCGGSDSRRKLPRCRVSGVGPSELLRRALHSMRREDYSCVEPRRRSSYCLPPTHVWDIDIWVIWICFGLWT